MRHRNPKQSLRIAVKRLLEGYARAEREDDWERYYESFSREGILELEITYDETDGLIDWLKEHEVIETYSVGGLTYIRGVK